MSGARRVLYQETRPAIILRAALGGSAMVMLALAVLLTEELQVRLILGLAAAAELAILFALHSMTVEIGTDGLRLRFGAGWIERRWEIGRIVSARAREWSWLRGAGLRVGLRTTTYLVTRGEVLEIGLEGGRRLLISVADARRACRALADSGVADIGG